MANKGPDTPPAEKGDEEAAKPEGTSLADQLKAKKEQLKTVGPIKNDKPASYDPFSNFKKAVDSKADTIQSTNTDESDDDWDIEEVEDELPPVQPSRSEQTTLPKASVAPVNAPPPSGSPITNRADPESTSRPPLSTKDEVTTSDAMGVAPPPPPPPAPAPPLAETDVVPGSENHMETIQKAMNIRRQVFDEEDDEDEEIEEENVSSSAEDIGHIGSPAQGSTTSPVAVAQATPEMGAPGMGVPSPPPETEVPATSGVDAPAVPPAPPPPVMSEVGTAEVAAEVDAPREDVPPPLPPRDDVSPTVSSRGVASGDVEVDVPGMDAEVDVLSEGEDVPPPPPPPREEEPEIPVQAVPKQATWTPPPGPPPPLPHREEEVPPPPPETPPPPEPAEVPLGPGPEETPIPPQEPEVPTPPESPESGMPEPNALTWTHTASPKISQETDPDLVEADIGDRAIEKQFRVLTMQAPKPVGERSATLTSSSNYQDLKSYLNEPENCAAHQLGHPVKETNMGFQPTLNLEFKNSKPAFAQQSEEGGVTYSASKNLSEQEWTDMVRNVTSLAVANAKPGASFDISHIKSPEKQKILENAFHEAIAKQNISPENAPKLITSKEDKKIQKPSV